jgi:hypothetical protein
MEPGRAGNLEPPVLLRITRYWVSVNYRTGLARYLLVILLFAPSFAEPPPFRLSILLMEHVIEKWSNYVVTVM